MKGNISKVRGVLGATGPKGDPSYPDWNQNDPTESDYIKNKPDLSLKEDKSNKVNSRAEIVSGDNSVEYPTVKFMMEELNLGDDGTLQDSKDYTNVKVREVGERVSTNEGVISQNRSDIINLENRVGNKEDKANKIQSIDALKNDEQYLSAAGTRALANTAEDNAKAHAEGLYGELNQRVTTNEKSIASAFGYCNELNERVEANEELIDSNVGRIIALENKTAELETDIGNVETALDSIIAEQEAIIAIQNNLIGGGSE